MDPTASRLVQALLAEALTRPPSERDEFLRERCADPELRLEIKALLAGQAPTLPFQMPATHVAGLADVDELSDLTSGSQIGPYTIIDHLGRGGMGHVFLGTDPRLRRKVALKCLIRSSSHHHELQSKILHEARAAASINHPNVAAIHDVVTHGGRAFIVMEYVEGESLASRLLRGPLPLADVLAIGRQLAAALVAAHANGVIHRDLKPANIQLTPTGPIKVLDFGIAKAMYATSATTAAESAIEAEPTAQPGTPAYMSPEQRLGRRVDERSDIYSVGVILFEMATGRRPYADMAPVNRGARHTTSAEGVSLRQVRAFDDLIAKALDPDPDRRFQSATELASALERVESALIHRLLVRRSRLGLAAMLAVVAAVGVVLVLRYRNTIETGGEVTRGRRTIAVLRLENMTHIAATADWPALIQLLLVSELTGAPDLAVMDPLGVNVLVDDPDASGSFRADRPPLELLRRAHVENVIGGRIVQDGTGYRLIGSVVDTASGESKFSARAQAADERALPEAVRSLGNEILSFLQVSGLQPVHDKDLRPWISLRTYKIDAVKAFVEGSQYIYRGQRDEGQKYLRRAADLDRTFIAPRIWLIPALQRNKQLDEAQTLYGTLRALEANASPFERAMIAYVGARLRGDRSTQARELDVALGYSPGNNILLLELATLRFDAGDCEGALEVMRPSIEGRWPYPAIYPLFAWCAIELGDFDEARNAIIYSRRFRQADAQEVGLLEALAIAVGEPESAAMFEKEFSDRLRETAHGSISSELVTAYDRLGSACLRSNRFAAAAVLFAKAVTADPNGAAHHDLLRQAYEKLGDHTAAEEERKRAEGLHVTSK